VKLSARNVENDLRRRLTRLAEDVEAAALRAVARALSRKE
jgi:hypothetical protein